MIDPIPLLADDFAKLEGPPNVMKVRDDIVLSLREHRVHVSPHGDLAGAYNTCMEFALYLRTWLAENPQPTDVAVDEKHQVVFHLTIDNTLAIAMNNLIQLRIVRGELLAAAQKRS